MTARFADDPETGGSRLTLTHGVFENEEDRVMHEQGWVGRMSQLYALLGES